MWMGRGYSIVVSIDEDRGSGCCCVARYEEGDVVMRVTKYESNNLIHYVQICVRSRLCAPLCGVFVLYAITLQNTYMSQWATDPLKTLITQVQPICKIRASISMLSRS